MESENTDYQVS